MGNDPRNIGKRKVGISYEGESHDTQMLKEPTSGVVREACSFQGKKLDKAFRAMRETSGR